MSDRQKEFEIEHRRGEVARLYLEGRSLRQVGTQLGVSHVTVKNDVDAIYEEWREDHKEYIDSAIVKELRKLDKIESEAWDGWLRSCKDAEKIVEESGATEKGDYTKSRTEVVPQAGDPRFLKVILDTIQRRCSILGIDAPKKIEDVTPVRTIEVQVTTPNEVHSVQDFMRSYAGSKN